MAPNLKDSLNKGLDAAIQNLFNNLISNLVNPTYNANKNDTPISRFEVGLKLVLQAYEQATQVIEKE